MQSNTNQQGPVPCRKGCGFYSLSGQDNLCSVCYKKELSKNTMVSSSSSSSPTSTSVTSIAKQTQDLNIGAKEATKTIDTEDSFADKSSCDSKEMSPSSEKDNASFNEKDSSSNVSKPDKKKSRCLSCKKKVGLTGFSCRCGGLFCSLHRYSDKHPCNFDYKALGADEITKNNPLVVTEKVKKL